MEQNKVIRIGTRGSRLALKQTDEVITVLKSRYPELNIEKVILHTKGDKILDKPLIEFGGKGVFITEFEEALSRGRIDLAVHSSKDMPMELAEGLVIAGVLPRADARDVLVMRKGAYPLPSGFVKKQEKERERKDTRKKIMIGTGSLRRQFQLQALYPEIQCISIRGNVPTRLQKVRDGICDGVVLAAAGLGRLGLLQESDFDYHYFSYEEMVPAGGQGIIAIEGREGDAVTDLVRSISDRNAWIELETERRILQLFEADCHEAVGTVSKVTNKQIAIQIIRESNGNIYRKQGRIELERRLELAKQMVDDL